MHGERDIQRWITELIDDAALLAKLDPSADKRHTDRAGYWRYSEVEKLLTLIINHAEAAMQTIKVVDFSPCDVVFIRRSVEAQIWGGDAIMTDNLHIWEIRPEDRPISQSWASGAKLLVHPNYKGGAYSYFMVDDAGRRVEANRRNVL